MHTFLLKDTVVSDNVDFHIWFAIGFAAALHLRLTGKPIVVTSLRDSSEHSDFSLHYEGKAVDLRLHDISPNQKADLFRQLKMALDPLGFDTIVEYLGSDREHIHCEFQPKTGEEFLTVLT